MNVRADGVERGVEECYIIPRDLPLKRPSLTVLVPASLHKFLSLRVP